MPYPDISAHLEAMRASVFHASDQTPLTTLPRSGSRRILPLDGSAYSAWAALTSMPSLQFGKDLKAAFPLAETRSILEEIAAEDRKLRDQQGLSALNLGLGIVAWEEADENYCFAPLYLQSIELDISRESIRVRSTGAAPELNETLLARLGIPKDEVPDVLPEDPEADIHPKIAGYEDRLVVGSFNQTRRLMASRLDPHRNPRLLNHATLTRLVLASRGDEAAVQLIRPQVLETHRALSVGQNLHRVRADSFQDSIITDTRSGCPELVVQGPPGTGKSQTIVNVIANAIQDGKSVLVMAEKMNAIEAVGKNLRSSPEASQVLTLQGESLNRTKVAEVLGVPETAGIINMLRSCPEHGRPKAILTSPEAFALCVPDDWTFDILVVDEASQMPLSSAAAAIAASRQLVVCGDSQQMPPDVPLWMDPGKGDAEMTSLLTAAERASFPTRMLEYHYRSRHPALIEASNRLFYRNRLRLVPSPLPAEYYGVKFHAASGIYDPTSRVNLEEAKQVVEAVQRFIRDAENKPMMARDWPKSIGIITMNEPQRLLIASLLQDCPEIDTLPADEPLFVKTISDVQGEERDIILVSLTYGRTASGELHPNLGPISTPSGDKRANVMMTRSRCRTELFASFNYTQWPPTTKPGIEALRILIRNAQKGSRAYAGKPYKGRLISEAIQELVTLDQFGRALCVKNRHGQYCAMIYPVGGFSALDETSEIEQLENAGWPVRLIPSEWLDEATHIEPADSKDLRLFIRRNQS
jgi:hypothetical protein